MRMDSFAFKLCFAAMAVALASCGGCRTSTSKPKGLVATIQFHLEVTPDASGWSMPVKVLRQQPVTLNVQKQPFLDERNVTNAVVVETLGGFAIKVQFDDYGTQLLEQYSTANRGQRCAILCRFGENKVFEQRWLAAPIFTRTISDGTLLFTPDATRAETDKIVEGLMNATKPNRKKETW